MQSQTGDQNPQTNHQHNEDNSEDRTVSSVSNDEVMERASSGDVPMRPEAQDAQGRSELQEPVASSANEIGLLPPQDSRQPPLSFLGSQSPSPQAGHQRRIFLLEPQSGQRQVEERHPHVAARRPVAGSAKQQVEPKRHLESTCQLNIESRKVDNQIRNATVINSQQTESGGSFGGTMRPQPEAGKPIDSGDRRRGDEGQSQPREAEESMGALQQQTPRPQESPSRVAARRSETGTPPIEFSFFTFNRQGKRQTPSSRRHELAQENSHEAKQACIENDSRAQHIHQLLQASPSRKDKVPQAATQQPNRLQKLVSARMSERTHSDESEEQCHSAKQQAGSFDNLEITEINQIGEDQLRHLKIPFALKSHKIVQLKDTSPDGDSSMDEEEANDVVGDQLRFGRPGRCVWPHKEGLQGAAVVKRDSVVGCNVMQNAESQRADGSVCLQAQPSAEGVSTSVLPSEATMEASSAQLVYGHFDNFQGRQKDIGLAQQFLNQADSNSQTQQLKFPDGAQRSHNEYLESEGKQFGLSAVQRAIPTLVRLQALKRALAHQVLGAMGSSPPDLSGTRTEAELASENGRRMQTYRFAQELLHQLQKLSRRIDEVGQMAEKCQHVAGNQADYEKLRDVMQRCNGSLQVDAANCDSSAYSRDMRKQFDFLIPTVYNQNFCSEIQCSPRFIDQNEMGQKVTRKQLESTKGENN